MEIQYCSDLHLEFQENSTYMKLSPIEAKGEILILAGDVVPFIQIDKHRDFFKYLSDHFSSTYWIPGNHEYYHSDINLRSGKLKETIEENVFLINNMTIEGDGFDIIFSTLWSRISPNNETRIERGMSDFRLIRDRDIYFSAKKYNEIHEDSKVFIQGELIRQRADKKIIVVTHHVPTYRNYPKEYLNSPISEGFTTELEDLIETCGPDYWIYGHHHRNIQDFAIGKTEMRTNQLGYIRYGENKDFDPSKCIIL